MKRISIITNGPGMAEVKTLYGQASDWVGKALKECSVDVNIIKGYEMDPLNPDDDDAWIITGSANSVYDDFEWIDYIKEKLFEMKRFGKPVLGICFGHQLIADAFGGEVILNPKGWELGSCRVNLTEDSMGSTLFSGLPRDLDVYQSHQDIVTQLPEDSVLLARNDMGIQSFVYNNSFYGVQFHPEFSKDVMEKYLDIRFQKGIIKHVPEVKECEYASEVLNNFIENIVK